jgi:hypothetical protein
LHLLQMCLCPPRACARARGEPDGGGDDNDDNAEDPAEAEDSAEAERRASGVQEKGGLAQRACGAAACGGGSVSACGEVGEDDRLGQDDKPGEDGGLGDNDGLGDNGASKEGRVARTADGGAASVWWARCESEVAWNKSARTWASRSRDTGVGVKSTEAASLWSQSKWWSEFRVDLRPEVGYGGISEWEGASKGIWDALSGI